MIIKWRELASADLDRIVDYVETHSAKAAYTVLEAIMAASRTLETFPNRGRPGRFPYKTGPIISLRRVKISLA